MDTNTAAQVSYDTAQYYIIARRDRTIIGPPNDPQLATKPRDKNTPHSPYTPQGYKYKGIQRPEDWTKRPADRHDQDRPGLVRETEN